MLTGATGTMGRATLPRLLKETGISKVKILVRPSAANKKKLTPLASNPKLEIVWGDLTNEADIRRAVAGADIVLHLGGMVSPAADWHPALTWRTNVGSMKLICKAVKECADADNVLVVYIGSVSQYGPRAVPFHWGRCGDPMMAAIGDVYALSKIAAESVLAESGLKRWISLRQTGILDPTLLLKGSDPISFHVPLRGALEWATAEQSGALMARLCVAELPASALRRFYNIGGGEKFRLDNYTFERLLMKALHCPSPQKVFDTKWFATRNFHGLWYADSDKLEALLPFRGDTSPESYFSFMAANTPFYFKFAGIVPAALIKAGMKMVAKKQPLGTLCWSGGADEERTRIFFGSEQRRNAIPDWGDFDLSPLPAEQRLLSHGYDEKKPESELDIADMRQAARFRGGKCISESMAKGDLYTPLEWECGRHHRFKATPATVLLGGHWCPDCFPTALGGADSHLCRWDYAAEARINPFLRQAWLSTHAPEEESVHTGPEI